MRISGCMLLLVLMACGGDENAPQQAQTQQLNTERETKQKSPEAPLDSAVAARVEKRQINQWPRLSHENAASFLKSYGAKAPDANLVDIKTDFGTVRVRLFEDTPIHRANFLYLIERNYFNPTQIVRVVKDFVVQGGNSEEVEDQEKRFLIGEYNLPNEIKREHLHFSGALAMSRKYEDNPEKRSAPYDFYIVDGKKCSKTELFQAQQDNGYTYTDAELQRYMQEGGAPHLDGEHTVIGEVIDGMEVIDQIAKVETDASEWPLREIEVRMEVVEQN